MVSFVQLRTFVFSLALGLSACIPFPAVESDSATGSSATSTTGTSPTTEESSSSTGPEQTTLATGLEVTTDALTQTPAETMAEPFCGDGMVEGDESCDDGNDQNTDECLNTCEFASCGDGFLQDGVESCDDANSDNTDECLDTCEPTFCGDGFLQDGEICDDGNQSNNDACLNTCVEAFCGDGFVHLGVEQCDVPDENPLCTQDTCQKTGLIVFVTSEKKTGQIVHGELTGIAAADAWCSDLATAFTTDVQSGSGYDDDGDPWPYKAWLSDSLQTPSLAPAFRFPSLADESYAGFAYVRRDGAIVAANKQGLVSDEPMLAVPINIDENAEPLPLDGEFVWTHTNRFGQSISFSTPCGYPAWTSSSNEGFARGGYANSTSSSWTDFNEKLCNEPFRIYCFEQPPEND